MCDNENCNCGECESWNCVEQAVNDVWSTKQSQVTELVSRAETAATNSEASAEASAESAAEAKEFRDEAEVAASTSTQALATITDAATALEETSQVIQQVADALLTAIAGISIKTWFYTTELENQTSITVPEDQNSLAVQYIVIEGLRQDMHRGYEFDVSTGIITLAEPLPLGTEVTVVLGTFNADNPQDFSQILASTNGARLVGLAQGGKVQDALWYLSFEMFGAVSTTATGVTDQTANINTCILAAKTLGLPIWSTGSYYVTGVVDFSGVKAYGFTLYGPSSATSQSVLINGDATLEDVVFDRIFMKHYNGNLKLSKFKFSRCRSTAAFISGQLTAQGAFHLREGEFTDCYYGILRQGDPGTSSPLRWAIMQDIKFFDMQADCIEMNLGVDDAYTLVEDILIDTVNYTGTNPFWGIAMGFAGKGSYALTDDKTNFYKNLIVRRCRIYKARQCIHFEKVWGATIEDVEIYPDNTTSTTSGLDAAGIVMYGCNDIQIKGVRGNPLNGTRMIWSSWGIVSGSYVAAARDIHISDVNVTGSVDINVSATNNYLGSVHMDDVKADTILVTGHASNYDLRNLRAPTLTLNFAPVFGDGRDNVNRPIRKKARLENLKSNDARMNPTGFTVTNLGVDELEVISCPILIEKTALASQARGTPLTKIDGIYVFQGTGFPIGYEFLRGDRIIDNNGVMYYVLTSGALLRPTSMSNQSNPLKALAVGATQIQPNVAESWQAANFYKTAGLRVVIPGAGVGGADLHTVLKRSAYVSAGVYTADLYDPIVTAVPDDTQLQLESTLTYITNGVA